MAAIITKEGFEVAVLPTAQQVRVTKEGFEVAVVPTTQRMRLSKLAMLVAYTQTPFTPTIPPVVPSGATSRGTGKAWLARKRRRENLQRQFGQ